MDYPETTHEERSSPERLPDLINYAEQWSGRTFRPGGRQARSFEPVIRPFIQRHTSFQVCSQST